MRSIRLTNFRSIADSGKIELKPLTVLVGANGSGKSSFLRFFPLLRQTAEARTESPLLWFHDGTGYVDFGDFGAAVRRGAEPAEIGVELEVDWDNRFLQEGWPATQNIALRSDEGRTFISHYVAENRWGRRVDVAFERFDVLARLIVNETDLVASARGWPGHTSRALLVPSVPNPQLDGTMGQLDTTLTLAIHGASMLGAAAFALWSYATGVIYIGPFRANPRRFYRIQELATREIDPSGENLAMFLRALKEPELEDLSRFVREHMGFSLRVKTEGMTVVLLLEEDGGAQFNLIDMGYRFSQVLPVVAQSWALQRRLKVPNDAVAPRMFAIEQPELHLHPAHQAKLADMFAGMVKATPVSLMVETHSQALVSRLGELIELGRLSPSDVSVLLFEKEPRSGVTSVRTAHFSAEGILENWPIGFFAP